MHHPFSFPSGRRGAVWAVLALSAALTLGSLSAVESFAPIRPDPLKEPWRWTTFGQFENAHLSSFAEAADGSLWLGFENSIVRFDGLAKTVYDQAHGLGEGPVKSLCLAKDGSLYALTRFQFLRYDGVGWSQVAKVDNRSGRGNRLIEAPDGAIWALTQTELLCFRAGRVSFFPDLPNPLSNFAIDARNRLWLAPQEGGGVWECPLVDGAPAPRSQWRLHRLYAPNLSAQFTLLAASDGSLWVASATDAGVPVARFAPQNGQWKFIDFKKYGGTNKIFSLAEAPDGSVLCGGWGRLQAVGASGGIKVYTPNDIPKLPFHWYSIHVSRDNSVWFCGATLNRIDCSTRQWDSLVGLGYQCQGPDGREWFLTRDNQIVVHDPGTETWKKYNAADGLMDHPVGVLVSRSGLVWAAGSDQGKASVARLEGERWSLDRHPAFANGIARQSLYESVSGDVYFGAEFERNASAGCSGGLLRYRFENGRWTVSNIAPPIIPFRIITIAEDDEGRFWFGGDMVACLKDGRSVDPGLPPRKLASFYQVARDPLHGGVWICEWGYGIYHYAAGKLRHYTQEEGLPSELVTAVGISASGKVWAAMPQMMSLFDGSRWSRAELPQQYGVDLGPSHLRTGNDETLWITTIAGSWYEPQRSGPADSEKESLLQSFRYRPERDPPDTTLLATVTEVAEKQSATFLWKGVDRWSVTPQEALQYSYRVDGGAWSTFSRVTNAVLTDLSPGRHTLEVRARDRDLNVDPTPAVARFAVIPAIWRQPWFVTLVGAFVATIAFLVWLLVRLRVHHVMQLGELKLRFFTNISHDLRTPLTAILGPLDRMIAETGESKGRRRLEIIRQNAQRMLKLVDQILDFRRVQLRAQAPAREATEVVAFIRAQRERLQPYAEDKAIEFRFTAQPAEFHAFADHDKLVKIVDNLVSNAIKYTSSGGQVTLDVACLPVAPGEDKYRLVLRVADSGIGIPEAEQKLVFDPFYRARQAENLPAHGSGIGLAITKELVEQCGGTISVESPVHPPEAPLCGTRFTVTMPLERNPQAASAKASVSDDEERQDDRTKTSEPGKPVVLIVEDNADIRQLLRDELEDSYEVIEAKDGDEGWSLAEARSPECVISDVMMPGMSGDALCAKLKANELTSHIPVILLTARKSLESQHRGLATGADEYLVKPVSFSLLRLRIGNLLKAREALRRKFGHQVFLAPSEVAVTPIDEQFVRRALKVVEEHMDDLEFDVETFARSMGLSRASLFRKFKALSGNTPSDFIRDMRLERARQLLSTGQLNVSETVARVGFSDLSHFGACFRRKFGETPSEVSSRNKSAGSPAGLGDAGKRKSSS